MNSFLSTNVWKECQETNKVPDDNPVLQVRFSRVWENVVSNGRTYATNVRPSSIVPKCHCAKTSWKESMKEKIKASLNPERSERKRTIGSLKNILKGRYHILKICRISIFGSSSPGPYIRPYFCGSSFRSLRASLSMSDVSRVSGTATRCKSCTAAPNLWDQTVRIRACDKK